MTTATISCSKVVCQDGIQTRLFLAYPFAPTDAGRAQSRRAKQRNDCTVRALATVQGLGYDEAYDLLAGAGRKCGRGFHLVDFLTGQEWTEKLSFPAQAGRPRMNLATFCQEYPQGRYICRVAKHVIAVIDGVVYDEQPSDPARCVYTAWRIA